MAANDAYSIIIVPADHSGTRQYTVTRRLVWVAASLGVILVVVMLGFMATYGQVLLRAREANRLEVENRHLRTQVASIDELGKELEDLSAIKAQILMMLGVEQTDLPDEVLQAGMADRRLASLELVGLDHMKAAERLMSFAPKRWPVEGFVSREFFLAEEGAEAHPGLDLVAPLGATIRAAGRARVQEARYDQYLGNYVVLDHGFGFTSLYAHNERLLVSEGQQVDQNQVIAYLGNTGQSSAPHLHFEIRVDGESVDPKLYLGPR